MLTQAERYQDELDNIIEVARVREDRAREDLRDNQSDLVAAIIEANFEDLLTDAASDLLGEYGLEISDINAINRALLDARVAFASEAAKVITEAAVLS